MQRRSSQLTVAMSRTFKRQTSWDVPLGASEMNIAFNATSRNYLTREETVEDIYDCTNEDLLIELVTARFRRLVLDFDVDPNMLAGWTSFNYGVAAAPSGGVNEIQTLTGGGGLTGSYQARFTVNYNTQTSAAIPIGSTAAATTALLEAMPNIGAGNVLCAGGPLNTATPMTATFQGALADLDVGTIEILSALAGGSITVDETTPGQGRLHAISRLIAYALPYTTLYVGFRGSDKQPVIFKNVVADVIRCRSTNREKVTATVQLIGSADLQHASAYTMPACYDIEPVRFGDCALLVNGSDLYQTGSVYNDPLNNIPLIRDWEYYHENGVEAKFDGQGIDVTRLERADRRPSGLTFGVLGEEDDPLYILGNQDKPRTIASGILRVGTANNNCKFNVPQGILKLENPPIRFEGRDNESNLRLMLRPKKISGDNTTPSNVSATTKQTTAYLVAA